MPPKKPQPIDPKTQKLIVGGFFVVVGLLFVAAIAIQVLSPGKEEKKESFERMVQVEQDTRRKRGQGTEDAAWEIGLRKAQANNPGEVSDGLNILYRTDRDRAGPYLQAGLQSPFVDARVTAATLLGQYNVPGTGPILAGMLDDPDRSVRSAAGSALANQYLAENVMSGIDDALGSRDATIAREAIAIWIKAYPKDPRGGVRAIRSAFRSRDVGVLNQAISAANSTLDSRDKDTVRSDVENVARDFPGTPAESAAKAFLGVS